MDIKTISLHELVQDKQESLADIEICKQALAIGIHEYTRGRVQDRLETNIKIVEKIDEELKRRTQA